MNKKELIQGVTDKLRENNVNKKVRASRHTLTISDNEGTSKTFVIKRPSKSLLFTDKDVSAMIDATIEVILDALKRGDNVSVSGFGTLGLKYRKPRSTKRPDTWERVEIPGHYIPKLTFGKQMRISAKLYELSKEEKERHEGEEPV